VPWPLPPQPAWLELMTSTYGNCLTPHGTEARSHHGRGRSAFDSAIRLTGAKLVLTYSPEELTNAINDNTAMIYTTDLGDKLKQVLAIAKEHKVPMLLDDAAGILPPTTRSSTRAWASICTASQAEGAVRPRKCSGLLLGRKDLIEAALLNCSPREGACAAR